MAIRDGPRYFFLFAYHVWYGDLFVAGLSELTAKEVIELVRRSGDRADFPDNIYGYGVPDMWKAYNEYKLKNK